MQYFHIWQKTLFGSPKLLKTILKQFNFDAKKAWENFNTKNLPIGIRKETREIIRRRKSLDPETEFKKLTFPVLPITDPAYPETLKNITDPPVTFYHKGTLDCTSKPIIAIVGSRKISPYGRKAVNRIIEGLSRYDITIVSGLAYGIDAHAHRTSLEAGLPNIAVIASGLDEIYPSPHRQLAREIVEKGGAIITENPPQTPSQKFMFPIRNRIIAGLAQAVIVVEAPKKSGALITANYAFTENRLLYAVPGDITGYRNEGCHDLIKNQKAVLLSDPLQIIEDLKLSTPNLKLKTEGMSESQKQILASISSRPLHLSRIADRTKLPHRNLLEGLMELEIAGHIRNVGAMHYMRV